MKLKTLTVGLCTIVLLASCGAKGDDARDEKGDKTIRIGASIAPYAEVLKHVEPALEKKGYKVEVEEFTDYVKSDRALADDELDTNFFQYKPYLVDWAKKANVLNKLASVFAIHLEPLGIYPNDRTSLKGVTDGQKISIPNDPTSDGRTLKLLADDGTITLKGSKDVDAAKQGIEAHNKKVEIIEIQAETCATSPPDADFTVVNGDNALNAKISGKTLVMESEDSKVAQIYASIVMVRTTHKDDEKTKGLIAVPNTEDVKKLIEGKYNGIVVPLVPVDE